MTNKDIQLSKSLSWILRHGANREGLILSSSGYIPLPDLLKHKSFKNYSHIDIVRVVENNDKQRFSLNLNKHTHIWEIKANQGHSIQDISNEELIPILEPKYSTVIHGTYLKSWLQIKSQGLSRMQRKNIHFAKGAFGDPNVTSGLRKNAQVHIHIDLAKALIDGIKFYESENGVILTEGDANGYLKPDYFLRAVKVLCGEQLYP